MHTHIQGSNKGKLRSSHSTTETSIGGKGVNHPCTIHPTQKSPAIKQNTSPAIACIAPTNFKAPKPPYRMQDCTRIAQARGSTIPPQQPHI